MAEIIEFSEHRDEGLFALSNLPQRGSIAKQAFGAGWPELDEILKFYLGQFIVVTGIAGHGKSTFVLNMLLKLARERRVKSFLYVPENEGHLLEKLRLMWPGDDASFDYFADRQCFVQTSLATRHDEPVHDLPWVLRRAERAVEREGVEIVVADPWNELDRAKPRDMLLTDYIGDCLMQIKAFCRVYPVIFIIVAHPTKAVNERGGRAVGLMDIEGSMNWFNKCDNGLIVSRDADKNTAKVISAKVREIGAGKIGTCFFAVDPTTGIFTPQYGGVVDGQH